MIKFHITFLEKVLFLFLSPAFIRIQGCNNREDYQKQFLLWSEFLSMWPFQLGGLARRVFYRELLHKCGINPIIKLGTIFIHPETEIGNNIFLGNYCSIGLASIGDDVMVAPGSKILSGGNQHSGNRNLSVRLREGSLKRVFIGSNVWIGSSAIIMNDVGDGAIVGAGTVVVRPVPAGATVVGNPARLINSLDPKDHHHYPSV